MKSNILTYQKFQSLQKRGFSTIPVYKKVLGDMLTPISAWVSLYDKSNYAFLFESVEKGSRFSRYSYIGINPKKIIKSINSKTFISKNGDFFEINKPFLKVLNDLQKNFASANLNNLPPFTGGLVGYLGYETIAWYEDIPIHESDEDSIPDAFFMLYNELIAFDHYEGTVVIISNSNSIDEKNSLDHYNNCLSTIDEIGELLHSRVNYETSIQRSHYELRSNFSKNDFKNAVKKAKEYIVNGDIFQLVLSQKFQKKTTADPTTIYRALRKVNPSPYLFHIKICDFDVIGSSPELLVKVEDEKIEIRPIAGTRARGNSVKEDKFLANDLLSDKKELAEHLMLIDLARNDVGKVSQYGSVKLTEKMVVEYFSHVMHIVSNVEGKLKNDKNAFDALKSGFPAGTVTGAPKLRAMELIHDLESERRGVYSGAIGFFDFKGNINSCIAIRTMVIKDDIVQFQSGAGIVYDSIPEDEYKETINKAKALVKAIELAENGLVI